MSVWQAIVNKHSVKPHSEAIAAREQLDYGTPLTDHKLLIVTGPDAQQFLQGQCTCDVARLAQKEWLLGAHCNAKGRMHSTFIAAPLAENVIGLKVHNSIADSALAALKKYIVFSKAEISLNSPPMMGLCLTEQGKKKLGTFLPLPEPGKISVIEGQATIIRVNKQRGEIWFTDEQQLGSLAEKLLSQVLLTESSFWHWLNINQGLAELNAPQMVEKLIPQELNYQLIDGISFNKGCYTGQEIIARMHYKAALKKHLYLCEINMPENLAPKIEAAILNSDGKKVGMVIDSAMTTPDTWQCLALVNDDAFGDDSLAIERATEAKLSWLPLPYAIPK